MELTRPVFVNGKAASVGYEIAEGDHIEILDTCTKEQLKEALVKSEDMEEKAKEDEVVVSVDAEVKEEPPKPKGESITVFVNGREITLTGKHYYIYIDVFDYIDFDLNDPKGRSIVTLHNGKNAKYMDALNNGDILEIYWKE